MLPIQMFQDGEGLLKACPATSRLCVLRELWTP